MKLSTQWLIILVANLVSVVVQVIKGIPEQSAFLLSFALVIVSHVLYNVFKKVEADNEKKK